MKFSNQLEAEKELDCYMYCLYESLKFFNKKEYENAALYLENAARSLRVLEELKVVENQSINVINVRVISRNYDGHY